ncbi:MAG: molybdopterin-dependent oxidoreductase, partial [Coriobacteriia bacterium]|nr:molybdopterin-dependent oxidoreductase [Coriobacteriia bacterium]
MFKREVNNDVYRDEWQWQEGEYTVTRTTHWSGPGCHEGCGVLIYTKDGKYVTTEGDPKNPYNRGRLCMRCLNNKEAIEHPDRVLYPMQRVGERGSNQWKRISWDEATDIIKEKSEYYTKKYGAKSILVCGGTGRNGFWQKTVFASNVFKTPLNTSAFSTGFSCYLPRVTVMNLTCGDAVLADCAQLYEEGFDHPEWRPPEYMIVWGNNPVVTNADGFYGHWVVDLMKQGTRLITIDPNLTWLAAKSDYWLQLRPGTDGALALAMLNVIINEDLYDHDFVENWTYGFEQLAERVQEYPPEKVAKICQISEEIIIESARAFAKVDVASIHWGLALDQQKYGVPAAHAIMCLWIITGNMDVPGGNILTHGARFQAECAAFFSKRAPKKDEVHPVLGYGAFPFLREVGSPPSPDIVIQVVEQNLPGAGSPVDYPFEVKMGFFTNTNTFVCMTADSRRAFDALDTLEFVVVADFYITPTVAAFADIILPLAMSCERDGMRSWWAPLRTISKVVDPPGECKSDDEMYLTLGKKISPELFPWENAREVMDSILEARSEDQFHITFDELEKKVYAYEGFEYRKHEKGLARFDGEMGFNTATGLAELYITLFEYVGLDPLPYYEEPTESPVSTPELAEEYPFVLTTGRRCYEFFHSEHRNQPTMREFHPDPIVELNDEDAAELGLRNGDWAWIENIHGKCKQKVSVLQGMKKGVVSTEHG